MEDVKDSIPHTIDWEMLAQSLSPDTLAAMKEHINKKTSEPSETERPEQQFGSSKAAATSNKVFSKREYWEERFEEEETYDWLVKFENVRDLICAHIRPTDNILIVGCGNSSFSNDLYDFGFHNITNIDYSSVLIDKMKAANTHARPLMKWIHMDMTELLFEKHSFDVVIDKAAMDALMVDEGDVWYPSEGVVVSVDKMCTGVVSVLKPDSGVFLQISFAQPHFRTKYLMGFHAQGELPGSAYDSHSGLSAKYGWDLQYRSIDIEQGCLNSHLYIMSMTPKSVDSVPNDNILKCTTK